MKQVKGFVCNHERLKVLLHFVQWEYVEYNKPDTYKVIA